MTIREEIWNKIKSIPINLYALGNRPIEDHCILLPLTDSALHLRLKASAALPQIEEAIRHIKMKNGNSLLVEQHKDYIVITSVVPE